MGTQPFLIPAIFKQLIGHYPEKDTFRNVYRKVQSEGRKSIIRLWLSEGIPFIFQDLPVSYEFIREWLSKHLGINPKLITIIGSARIGYSMAPSEYGRSFGSNSDLDFSIVSEELFNKLSAEFYKWKEDTEKGLIQRPNSLNKRRYWEDNLKRLPYNIKRGFIDPYKIPYIPERYPTAQKIGHTKWLLREKLSVTPDVPRVKKASIRVYRDWKAFVAQVKINLDNCLLKNFDIKQRI